ncbi:Methyltransferase-like protein 6 [Irineochytrium annulatum]|nr:Methyltransferase-like protein 6 [Irineochytrium annulatum]
MTENRISMADEKFWDKLKLKMTSVRKTYENPFVLPGVGMAVFAMYRMFNAMYASDGLAFQRAQRLRVVAQGTAVIALLGGAYVSYSKRRIEPNTASPQPAQNPDVAYIQVFEYRNTRQNVPQHHFDPFCACMFQLRKIAEIYAAQAAKPVSEWAASKLKQDARRNWDLFYKRNTTNFFKDRHWTTREFQELDHLHGKKLLELGCGVGNAIWPLIEKDEGQDFFVYACDFSERAVKFVRDNPLYNPSKCKAFVADLTEENSLVDNIPEGSIDVVIALFVLSAIPPEKMSYVVENVRRVMRPGGCLLFRDYAIADQAELRFKPGKMISEHFYTRQDGTFTLFFSVPYSKSLFEGAGFEVVENGYVNKEVENRKKELVMGRRYLQGKYKLV